MKLAGICTLLLAAFILFACSKPVPPPPSPTSEEYAIYTKIIDSLYGQDPPQVQHSFAWVSKSTVAPYRMLHFRSGQGEPVPWGRVGRVVHNFDSIPAMVWNPKFGSVDAPDGVFGFLADILPEYDWKSIKACFDSVNTARYALDSVTFSTSSGLFPVRLLSEDEFQRLSEQDTEPFYGGRWVRFSRVGFDHSGTVAIVYFTFGRDGGGTEQYWILKKEDSHWVTLWRLYEDWL